MSAFFLAAVVVELVVVVVEVVVVVVVEVDVEVLKGVVVEDADTLTSP